MIHGGLIFSLVILNYNNVDNIMAVSLFRMKTNSSNDHESNNLDSSIIYDSTDTGKDGEALTVPKCSNIKDFISNMIPDRLQCCRCCTKKTGSHRDRALTKARVLLA